MFATINITIPARNEELILEKNLRELLDFCQKNLADDWFIVLSNSASADKTTEIGQRLAAAEPHLKYFHNNQPGKGRAIRAGWIAFPADYYVFMDADLSTDLSALPQLLTELKNGTDLVIGSRYLPKAKMQRSLIRLIISKTYRFLAQAWLSLPFSDIPCGFKAINHRLVQELLPQIKNQEWFFDTELLYRAWRNKYLIKEIPVHWTEIPNRGRKSRVGILRVSWNYLKELIKLKTSP